MIEKNKHLDYFDFCRMVNNDWKAIDTRLETYLKWMHRNGAEHHTAAKYNKFLDDFAILLAEELHLK